MTGVRDGWTQPGFDAAGFGGCDGVVGPQLAEPVDAAVHNQGVPPAGPVPRDSDEAAAFRSEELARGAGGAVGRGRAADPQEFGPAGTKEGNGVARQAKATASTIIERSLFIRRIYDVRVDGNPVYRPPPGPVLSAVVRQWFAVKGWTGSVGELDPRPRSEADPAFADRPPA